MRRERPKPTWNKSGEFFRSDYPNETPRNWWNYSPTETATTRNGSQQTKMTGNIPFLACHLRFRWRREHIVVTKKAVPLIHLVAQLALEFNSFDDNGGHVLEYLTKASTQLACKHDRQRVGSYILDTTGPFATVGSVNETGWTKISMDPQLRRKTAIRTISRTLDSNSSRNGIRGR